jgi:hypothetical protein
MDLRQLRQKTNEYVGRLYQGFDMDVVSQNLSRMNWFEEEPLPTLTHTVLVMFVATAT